MDMYGVYTPYIPIGMAMARKRKSAKTDRIRSDERLSFAYHEKDSPTGVRRSTVKRLASELNMSETRFLHLGAARLVQKLSQETAKYTPTKRSDNGRMTDRQLNAIRSMVPQDHEPTSSFLDLLDDPE